MQNKMDDKFLNCGKIFMSSSTKSEPIYSKKQQTSVEIELPFIYNVYSYSEKISKSLGSIINITDQEITKSVDYRGDIFSKDLGMNRETSEGMGTKSINSGKRKYRIKPTLSVSKNTFTRSSAKRKISAGSEMASKRHKLEVASNSKKENKLIIPGRSVRKRKTSIGFERVSKRQKSDVTSDSKNKNKFIIHVELDSEFTATEENICPRTIN